MAKKTFENPTVWTPIACKSVFNHGTSLLVK